MNPTVSPLIRNQSQSLLARRPSNGEVHLSQVSHCERRMAIDLVMMADQSVARTKPMLSTNGIPGEPLPKLHQPSDLIELIKMTNKPSQKAHKLWRSRQFSLTDLDFHPFDLRKLIRSLSPKSVKDNSNVPNGLTGKIKQNFRKEDSTCNNQTTIDKCQRVELQNTQPPSVNSEQTNEASYQSICDTILGPDTKLDLDINVSHNVISSSSSTETIKVEDRVSAEIELDDNVRPQLLTEQFKAKHQDESSDNIELNSQKVTRSNVSELKSILTKSRNNLEQPKLSSSCADEEILETLRRVVRVCTKTDLSKRASATEVHAQLEAAITSSRLSRSRANDRAENEGNNCQHQQETYLDDSVSSLRCPATDSLEASQCQLLIHHSNGHSVTSEL